MQSSGAVDAPDSYRAILTDLYTRYNPEKLAKIDYILDKFVGKEEEVIAAVREKYGDNGDSSGPSIHTEENPGHYVCVHECSVYDIADPARARSIGSLPAQTKVTVVHVQHIGEQDYLKCKLPHTHEFKVGYGWVSLRSKWVKTETLHKKGSTFGGLKECYVRLSHDELLLSQPDLTHCHVLGLKGVTVNSIKKHGEIFVVQGMVSNKKEVHTLVANSAAQASAWVAIILSTVGAARAGIDISTLSLVSLEEGGLTSKHHRGKQGHLPPSGPPPTASAHHRHHNHHKHKQGVKISDHEIAPPPPNALPGAPSLPAAPLLPLDCFQRFDADSDGTLSAPELTAMMHTLGYDTVTDEYVRGLMRTFGAKVADSPGIHMPQFHALYEFLSVGDVALAPVESSSAVAAHELKQLSIAERFDIFDKTNDDVLDVSEVADAFRTSGHPVSLEFVHGVVEGFDPTQRSTITRRDGEQLLVFLDQFPQARELCASADTIHSQFELYADPEKGLPVAKVSVLVHSMWGDTLHWTAQDLKHAIAQRDGMRTGVLRAPTFLALVRHLEGAELFHECREFNPNRAHRLHAFRKAVHMVETLESMLVDRRQTDTPWETHSTILLAMEAERRVSNEDEMAKHGISAGSAKLLAAKAAVEDASRIHEKALLEGTRRREEVAAHDKARVLGRLAKEREMAEHAEIERHHHAVQHWHQAQELDRVNNMMQKLNNRHKISPSIATFINNKASATQARLLPPPPPAPTLVKLKKNMIIGYGMVLDKQLFVVRLVDQLSLNALTQHAKAGPARLAGVQLAQKLRTVNGVEIETKKEADKAIARSPGGVVELMLLPPNPEALPTTSPPPPPPEPAAGALETAKRHSIAPKDPAEWAAEMAEVAALGTMLVHCSGPGNMSGTTEMFFAPSHTDEYKAWLVAKHTASSAPPVPAFAPRAPDYAPVDFGFQPMLTYNPKHYVYTRKRVDHGMFTDWGVERQLHRGEGDPEPGAGEDLAGPDGLIPLPPRRPPSPAPEPEPEPPRPPCFTSFVEGSPAIFVTFMRQLLSYIEDFCGMNNYHMQVVALPRTKKPNKQRASLEAIEFGDGVLAAANAAGFYILIVGKQHMHAESGNLAVPDAEALLDLDKPLSYTDKNGKHVECKERVTMRQLCVGEGALTKCFLDAKARPMYVCTMNRFVRRLNELSDFEMRDLWLLACHVTEKAQTKQHPGTFSCMKLNAGSYQNVSHLHLKVTLNEGAFEAIWANNETFKRLQSSLVLSKRTPKLGKLGYYGHIIGRGMVKAAPLIF